MCRRLCSEAVEAVTAKTQGGRRSSDMPLKGIVGNQPLSPSVSKLLAFPCASALMFLFDMGPKVMRPTNHGLKSPKTRSQKKSFRAGEMAEWLRDLRSEWLRDPVALL